MHILRQLHEHVTTYVYLKSMTSNVRYFFFCSQCPHSARTVPAQCPHSARCKFPLDLRMSRCQRIGGPRHPTSIVVWPYLMVIYSGHCAGTVRALSGHCAGTVRALYSAYKNAYIYKYLHTYICVNDTIDGRTKRETQTTTNELYENRFTQVAQYLNPSHPSIDCMGAAPQGKRHNQ